MNFSVDSTITRRTTLTLLVAGSLFATACGSDDSSSSDADATTNTIEQVTDTAEQGNEASEAEATRLWIKPDLVECEGVAPQQCLEVATSADGPYELFYDSIDGYDHEEGTSAVIDVTIEEIDHAPADASSLEYTLIEVIETGQDDDA